MEKTEKKYRLTHDELKNELKRERKKYYSKGKFINIVCVLLALLALALVLVYAANNGLL